MERMSGQRSNLCRCDKDSRDRITEENTQKVVAELKISTADSRAPLGGLLLAGCFSPLSQPGGSDFGRTVSRILSSSHEAKERTICLSGRYPGQSGPLYRPLFGLAPGGVYHAPEFAFRAVRSYRTFSPLPSRGRRFNFLQHFPAIRLPTNLPHVSPLPGLRGATPCGVRTFLPPAEAKERFSVLPKSTRR